MEFIEWVIKIALVFLAIQYLLGPVVVWWSQKLPEAYRFEKLDAEKFLSERSGTFLSLHREILDSGFNYIGSSELLMSQATTYFSIYYNPETTLCCTLSSVHSKPATTTQIEFTQLFADGAAVNVNNNPIFDVNPRWDKKIVYRFPNINNFPELLNAANRLVGKYGNSKKTGLPPGEEFQTIERYLMRELMRLVSRGWVSENVVNGQRRLTVMGAIVFTWKLCWPVKAVLSAMDESRSRQALQSA